MKIHVPEQELKITTDDVSLDASLPLAPSEQPESLGIQGDIDRHINTLKTASRGLDGKAQVLEALDRLGDMAESLADNRGIFVDATKEIRQLCAGTEEAIVIVAAFRALERIGLKEDDTKTMLEGKMKAADNSYLSGAATHTLLAMASQPQSKAA